MTSRKVYEVWYATILSVSYNLFIHYAVLNDGLCYRASHRVQVRSVSCLDTFF